jgi:hypothetical protein
MPVRESIGGSVTLRLAFNGEHSVGEPDTNQKHRDDLRSSLHKLFARPARGFFCAESEHEKAPPPIKGAGQTSRGLLRGCLHAWMVGRLRNLHDSA